MKLSSFEAAAAYGAAKSAVRPSPPEKSESAGLAFEAIKKLASVIEESERQSIGLMTGAADPHSVVEAIAAAELAIETAVTVRDKVVEAYQELLRMPV
jgi:flagellar hook-basal body complex protein FliE